MNSLINAGSFYLTVMAIVELIGAGFAIVVGLIVLILVIKDFFFN